MVNPYHFGPVPSVRQGNLHGYTVQSDTHKLQSDTQKVQKRNKSISAVFVILKLPLQKSNGQVQVQLALPNSNRRRRYLKWLQVTVEDVGMYHHQKSEKRARNVCWPKHEGDTNECCTAFYKAKQETGNWSLDTGQSNNIFPA